MLSASSLPGVQEILGSLTRKSPWRSGSPYRAGQLLHSQNPSDPPLVCAPAPSHLHFTPTHGSWLNLIERWFGSLTERQIKRGSHRSTLQLQQAIRDFIETTNNQPKAFVWTKSADEILASITRFATATKQVHGA